MAAAEDSVDANVWLEQFDCAFARIAGRFSRVEPRRRAQAFLLGLLSDVDGRLCWQLAERGFHREGHRGHRRPVAPSFDKLGQARAGGRNGVGPYAEGKAGEAGDEPGSDERGQQAAPEGA